MIDAAEKEANVLKEKKRLEVSDLLKKFEQASDGEFANDRMMLTN